MAPVWIHPTIGGLISSAIVPGSELGPRSVDRPTAHVIEDLAGHHLGIGDPVVE